MKILFLGDLVGKPAREATAEFLREQKAIWGWDFVVANADNLAHGRGVTERTLLEMQAAGVDVLTAGDHLWDNPQGLTALKHEEINFTGFVNVEESPEMGCKRFWAGEHEIWVMGLLGQIYIDRPVTSPFAAAEKFLADKAGKIVLVDVHSEATSEKRALAEFLDGRVTAVLGTHTHVQTADEQMLVGGTAFISDVGMVGVRDSILGARKEAVIGAFVSGEKFKYVLAEGEEVLVSGVMLEVNEADGRARSISRILEVVKL